MKMAGRTGLKRAWFQTDASIPHYDIGTPRIRTLAVKLGAVECDRLTFVGHMRRIRSLGGSSCP